MGVASRPRHGDRVRARSSDNNVPVIPSGGGSGGWHLVDGPNPSGGKGSAILGGIANVDGTLWAAGTYSAGNQRLTFLEHG
jgi:hypothetical protein